MVLDLSHCISIKILYFSFLYFLRYAALIFKVVIYVINIILVINDFLNNFNCNLIQFNNFLCSSLHFCETYRNFMEI